MVSGDVPLEVPRALGTVLPASLTNVEQYFGSFVRLKCVSADDEKFEVRVYLADWVFLSKGETLANSDDIAVNNNPKLSALNGEKLLHVIVASKAELWLMFTGDMALKLTANLDEYDPEDELLVISLDLVFVEFSPTNGFVVAPRRHPEH